MEDIFLNSSELQREFAIAPPVRSLAYHTSHSFMKRQVITSLQICIRFHATMETLNVNIDGVDYQAGFPQLLIKRCGEIHHIDDAGTSDSFYFTYKQEDAPHIPVDLIISEIQLTPEIHALFHQIIKLLFHSRKFGVCDRIDYLCQQLLVELLLLYRHNGRRVSESDVKIQKISSYLQMHFSEDFNFDDIARHFGYSLRSFYRHWWQYYNDSPGRYVAALKFSEAKRLLAETDLSVESISRCLNYRGSAYFISYFRKHAGITPLQYRKTVSLR